MNEIARLQENLLLIRRSVGWSAETLGERIGVTRQTINNIEAGRNKLNKTQYIAIRAVLDAEMERSPKDTEFLALILEVFVDHPERYSDKNKKELLDKANMIAPSILAKTASRRDVSIEMISMATAILGMAAGVLASTVHASAPREWIKKILGDRH